MQLKHFLPILPADIDEIEQPSTPLRAHSYYQSHHGLLSFVSHLVCGVHHWGWRWSNFFDCYEAGGHSYHFQDTPGVDLSQKVASSNNPRIFSFAKLNISSKGFSKDEILGSSGFGCVYKALLPSNGTIVAVKCFSEKGEQFEKTFATELMAFAQLCHRNLVRLRDWCVQ
ncbi:hypothetical protein NE237_031414 [Protea cynaroides]|uniref:Protein kinase domain-containing protein n=1 Tax=Protea cynaroides TaxID=273540 RepID=A0A9Q0R2H0_9MAGN|nr:hypothetical protein NE237_031414 [Protea cynaroides]